MSDSGITGAMPKSVSVLTSKAVVPETIVCASDAKLQAIAASRVSVAAMLWQRVFSFPAMLGALLVGAVAIIARTFFVDPDVWWHIKQGEFILTTGHVPTKDIYSLTLAGRPWTAYEWLGD